MTVTIDQIHLSESLLADSTGFHGVADVALDWHQTDEHTWQALDQRGTFALVLTVAALDDGTYSFQSQRGDVCVGCDGCVESGDTTLGWGDDVASLEDAKAACAILAGAYEANAERDRPDPDEFPEGRDPDCRRREDVDEEFCSCEQVSWADVAAAEAIGKAGGTVVLPWAALAYQWPEGAVSLRYNLAGPQTDCRVAWKAAQGDATYYSDLPLDNPVEVLFAIPEGRTVCDACSQEERTAECAWGASAS